MSRAVLHSVPERQSVSVDEARTLILDSVHPLGPETVGLREALGRVVTEPIVADRDIPPRDNSAMDGFAVRASDTDSIPATLRVTAEIAAGGRADRKLGPGEAARILTGAHIPEGADAVVMQENTERGDASLTVLASVRAGENVRFAGCDVAPGTSIAEPGTRLGPAHVGMLAAIGRTQVSVVTKPRVAVLATGDELVEPDRLVDDGRIVSSNSYSLQAALLDAGMEPVLFGIARDEPDVIADHFRRALHCDAIVSTGGVSVGDRDWIKLVLSELGGEMKLWRVRMKPGAPLAFVVLDGRPVFGLPGNPVSSLVTFEQFVRPALLRMRGHLELFRPVEHAVLTRDYTKPAGRAHYIRVTLERRAGQLHATPTADQSSGVLLSMLQAEALAFVAEQETRVDSGTLLPVQMLCRSDLCAEPGH